MASDPCSNELEEELEYLDKDGALKREAQMLSGEFQQLEIRRQFIKKQLELLNEARRDLDVRQAALLRERDALDMEEVRLVEDQRATAQAEEDLLAQQHALDTVVLRRHRAKVVSHAEAQRYVSDAQDENAFNALNEALKVDAPLAVLRAIVEVHIGGVDCQNSGYNMWTPLHYASWHGHTPLCELLVANGASLNVQDTYSHYTPLDWALSRHHAKTAKCLTAMGARRAATLTKDALISTL